MKLPFLQKHKWPGIKESDEYMLNSKSGELMPLMPGKSRKAFSHNVKTEMEHGKPQKQAVAIAYNEEGEHKANGGACGVCGKMNCYEHGGRVSDHELKKQREAMKHEPFKPAGTTDSFSLKGKQTPIGKMQREEDLKEFKKSQGPNIKGLADGGEVADMEHDGEESEESIDNELHEMIADELIDALEKKDKRAVVDAIKALVLSCKE